MTPLPSLGASSGAPRSSFVVSILGIAALAGTLAGCGAGTGAPPAQSRTLGGFAIDGYLADAEIRCLDADGAVVAASRTTSTGAWIMRIRTASASCKTLEASDGIDVGTNPSNFTERSTVPLGTRFTASIAHLDPARLGNLPLVISPLTSLTHSLQAQRGLSPAAARSAILLPLGLPDSIDPLVDNPIASGNARLFGAGVLAATIIRDTNAGILDAIARNGQVISLDLRRQIHQQVTHSFAELARSGVLSRAALANDQPAPDSPLALLAEDALNRMRSGPPALSGMVAGLQFDAVRTIVAQYSGKSGAEVSRAIDSTDLSQIARVAAAQNQASQTNLHRPRILGALGAEPNLALVSLAAAVRTAFNGGTNRLIAEKTDGSRAIEVSLSNSLQDYLKVAGEQLRFFTTADNATGQAISVADFERGTAPALSGALSAVSLAFTQPQGSTLLSESAEKTVQLGFRVERVDPAGVMNIRLAAVVDRVRIKWSPEGLVVRTPDDSTLYGSFRIGANAEDSPLTLSNTNNRLANLVSTTAGSLRIDMAGFLAALGLNPEAILQTYLSDSVLTVEAVISDIVIARGPDTSAQKLADLSISVARDGGQAALNILGAGLRGTVTAGR